jgi:protein involved in temperature-dependent protein secretion
VKLVGHPYKVAYMPARYILPENREEHTNSLLIGTETIWWEFYDGFWQGYGRKTWFADGNPFSIFEASRIDIEH